MEQLPNSEIKQENPNKLIEGLRKKIRIAFLCGSISLTALVAVGCGSKENKQTGASEGASRFPRAEQIEKQELEKRKSIYPKAEDVARIGIRNERKRIDDKFNEIRKQEEITEKRALEIVKKHGIETYVKKMETRSVGNVPISITCDGKKIEVTREDLTKEELDTLKTMAWTFSDSEIYNDDSSEMKAQKKEITKNNRETRTILERLGVIGSVPKTNQVRQSPNFESGVKGSREVDF